MVKKELVRKAVEISWDTNVVKGFTANIKATMGDDVSTRDGVVNDGRALLTFPGDFHGASEVSVKGSKGGTDEGTISV